MADAAFPRAPIHGSRPSSPAEPLQLARQLDARADVELAVDGAQVRLDRAGADDELVGDLAVGAPGGDELGDLALAGRQGAAVLISRRAHDAMPQAPQLPGGVGAQALGAERVQLALGVAQGLDRRSALPRRRERTALGEPGAGRGERGAVCGLAGGHGGADRVVGLAARQQQGAARAPGDGCGPGRRELGRRPLPVRERVRGRGEVVDGQMGLDEVCCRRRPVGGQDVGQAGAERAASTATARSGLPAALERRAEAHPGCPAAWKSASTPAAAACPRGAARRRRRRRRGARRREHAPAPTGRCRGLPARRARSRPSSAARRRAPQPPELHERRHGLDHEHRPGCVRGPSPRRWRRPARGLRAPPRTGRGRAGLVRASRTPAGAWRAARR